MSADRDRETRQAEAREEIAEASWEAADGYMSGVPWERAGPWKQAKEYRRADAVLALPALRAAGEHDRLRRDLAALAEELDQDGKRYVDRVRRYGFYDGVSQTSIQAAARIRALLDGGEGGR